MILQIMCSINFRNVLCVAIVCHIFHVQNQNKLRTWFLIYFDPSELANYRPISNLSFMSKILEKAVSAQLCSILQNNYIYGELHWFQAPP